MEVFGNGVELKSDKIKSNGEAAQKKDHEANSRRRKSVAEHIHQKSSGKMTQGMQKVSSIESGGLKVLGKSNGKHGEMDLDHDPASLTGLSTCLCSLPPPLHPGAGLLTEWDGITLLAMMYTALITPFELGFIGSAAGDALYACNRAIDVVFFLDIILAFNQKIQDKNGVWVADRRMIAKTYLKGWFPLDLISVVPFDAIGKAVPVVSNLQALRMLRLLKLLKLLRLIRAQRVFQRWEDSISISNATIGIAKWTSVILVVMHW